MTEWTDAELEASVVAYRKMQKLDADGNRYSKKDFYEELSHRFGRTSKAIEYRMQNISAVLHRLGKPWVKGLKPAGNVGANVTPRIEDLLVKHHWHERHEEPAYKAKLPALREWLIRVARMKHTVTYGDVMAAFGMHRFSLRYALGNLGNQSRNLREPILTALVVNKNTRQCGSGFKAEFGIKNDEAERQKLYKFWKEREVEFSAPSVTETSEERTARFVSVEARPDQAAFRRLVFEACGGRCVISGCDVLPALDAAHKVGSDWRKGHNAVSDGYLMRKDLHALYDAGWLKITANGTIKLNEKARAQYGEFAGKKIVILRA